MATPTAARSVLRSMLLSTALLSGCASSHLSEPGDHGPLCSAIQTASTLQSSSERAEALRRLAGNEELTAHEQLYLVDATLQGGRFSSDKTEVWITLLNNPVVTPAARNRIAECATWTGLLASDLNRLTDALTASARRAGR